MEITTVQPNQVLAYFASTVALVSVIVVVGQAANALLCRLLGQALIYGNFCLKIVLGAATGWSLIIAVLLVFGVAGLFYVEIFIAIILILFVWAIIYLYPGDLKRSKKLASNADIYWYNPLIIVCIAVFISAMKPPGDWDDTMYHLPYARHFVDRHGIEVNPYLRYPFLPQNVHLIFALALSLSDEYFAQALNASFTVLTILGTFGLTQRLAGKYPLSYFSIGGFLSFHFVTQKIGYAYIDHALTFFVLASVIAFVAWQQSGQTQSPWVWLVGLFTGDAIGTKVFGAFAALPMLFWVAWDYKCLKVIVRFLAVAIIAGGYWYINSFWHTGNPFHPVGSEVFGYYMWSADDLQRQFAEQARHAIPKTLTNLLWAVAAPSVNVKGYILWLSIVSVFWWRVMPKEQRFLYVVFIGYYALWFFIAQIKRYLMPALPIGCVLAALTGDRIFAPIMSRSSGGCRTKLHGFAFLLAFTVASVWFCYCWKGYAILRRAGFDHFSNNSYNVMRAANLFMADYGRTLVHIGFENGVYFFRGTAIGDQFGPGRYSQWFDTGGIAADCQLRQPPDLVKLMRVFGAGMLAVDTDHYCVDSALMEKGFDFLYKDNHAVLYGLRRSD